MKKLLVLFLALVVCMSSLVACELPFELPFDLPFFGEEEPAEVTYKLDKAVAYVKNLYNSEQVKPEGSDTAFATKYDDFKLVSQVPIAGVMYEVVWSVDVTDESKVKVVQGQGTTETLIDIDAKTQEDISFTLTATIKAGDGTSDSSLKFNFFVPKYDVISYDDYRAKADGESATIEGIVVALNSKEAGNKRNHIFAVDPSGKGGYYAYDMADDPAKLGIEVGMTVAISGEVDIFNGMYELKGATARIINSEKTTPAAIDISTKFGAGENILEYVGALVTIKGVEIGGQELDVANSQYLFFSLNGVESYIRTYVTDLPTSFELVRDADDVLTCADKAVIDGAHAEKFGWTANVTGVLIAYNGAPYLMPVDANCFEYTEFVQKSADEKIDIVLDEITMVDKLGADKVVEIVSSNANYPEVVISWASNSEYAVVAEDGKSISFTIPKAATTVTITVTGTIGDVKDTRTFEVALTPVTVSYVANTPYYFGFTDKDGNKKYLDGTTASNANYRWNLTDDVTKAVPFYVEVVEGGYHLYFLNGTTKTYLNIVKNGNYTNLLASDTAVSTWTYDVSLETLVVDVEGTVFVPKNYNNYKNVEAKKFDYTNNDTYVIGLVAIEYNFGFENNGAMQYLDGANAGGKDFRWNLTADKTLAAAFFIEGNADGSCYIYFYREGVKTYLNIVKNGTYINLLAGDKGESKWVYNAEHKAYVVDVDGTLYVPKNYNNYTNVEAKKIDYTNNATFILSLYNVGYAPAASETPETVDPNSIKAYAAANGWVNSTLYDTITLANGAKVTASGTPVGEYALNTGKFYTSDNTWRIYQTETPSVVITAAEGKTIASVKITYNIKNTGTLTLNGENIASGTVVTVNASSITFSVGNTGTATNGQAQITAIEVVYA